MQREDLKKRVRKVAEARIKRIFFWKSRAFKDYQTRKLADVLLKQIVKKHELPMQVSS